MGDRKYLVSRILSKTSYRPFLHLYLVTHRSHYQDLQDEFQTVRSDYHNDILSVFFFFFFCHIQIKDHLMPCLTHGVLGSKSFERRGGRKERMLGTHFARAFQPNFSSF